jgi:Holliday junction resolvasome RuvABC endonuclease subunit
MKILALDVATKTGWACDEGSGVWNLKTKSDESGGMRLIRFRAKLAELHSLNPIDVVVFERPAGRNALAIIRQSELHGVLKTFCEDNQIEYRSYSATEIKKHATGKGNAGKPQMIQAAKEKFPSVQLVDDNHADALWLLDLAKTDLMNDK